MNDTDFYFLKFALRHSVEEFRLHENVYEWYSKALER